ncbi:MAG: tetratricopeptide repeat protein [Bacteroidales bacterium]|nr:tetratricopeptide repeat protein [Bacteroidales bacterium]
MKRLIISIAAVFISLSLWPQKTVYHDRAATAFRKGLDLFQKEKYGAAKNQFENVVRLIDEPQDEMQANASYYRAVCSVRLFNNDGEVLLNDFINNYPEHAYTNHAHFYLGSFYHSKRNYTKALRAFEKVDIRNLSAEELAEYHFKIGYCYFNKNDYEAASKSFYEIKDVANKYMAPANYYFGHIAYYNGNWETAQISFSKLVDDPHFGSLVPYYIVHIYYMQERFTELLERATPLLERAEPAKVPEIARIIGEAYYKQQKYREALPFLVTFAEKQTGVMVREDKYQLGFCYYRTGDYEKAINYLSETTTETDSLSQNAYYILADCYLQTNQMQFARNAFYSAYRGEFDERIRQSALLNYAKLSYQLSTNPFNDAVEALMLYIDTYPNAIDIDEANSLLVNVFFSTKNYRAALTSIEKIQFQTTELKMAYQKIAYLRGLELFNNRDFTEAISHFNKSLTQIFDVGISAEAVYWKSESYYRLNRFDSAEVNYNKFLLSQGAFQLPIYNMANYNLAYALFKQLKYDASITSFRKYIMSAPAAESRFINDANVRLGDGYYVTKNYTSAIEFYNKVIVAHAANEDYALYQKAICYGVLADFNNKSTTLLELINNHPNSSFVIDAKYELANNYLAIGDNVNALTYFNDIINNHPSSSYRANSMLKSGLIYFNTSQYEQGLQILKRVVSDFPGTTASRDALVIISDIYVAINKPADFFVYVQNIPFANISSAEQDSLTYLAAQNQYMLGDCESALRGFNNYLDNFPEGISEINARFYRAECLNRSGRFNDALRDYNYIISKHRTEFTESSLVKAAGIYFSNRNYTDALTNYIKLELIAEMRENIILSQTGQMRSYFLTNNFEKSIEASEKLLQQERIEESLIQEARLIMGKSHFNMDRISHAQSEFLAVTRISENEMKAEAKYFLALIQYNLGNYSESEKLVFEVINQMPSYSYWIARSFILLSDNLVAMGNIFQAKHTLQSIIDNYEDDLTIVQMAFEKLNKIIEDEKARAQFINENTEQPILQEDSLEINY